MQIKSLTTVTGVNEIDFGNDDSQTTAHFYWFKNLSDSTLYVSAKPDPVAGKDDVAELSAKGAVSVETDEGKVYVLGAGKVEIHRTNSKFCPFELPSTGSGGGGGGSITVDSELSETSINPLQNKATTKAINEVKTELSGKSNTGHTHLTSEITDFPDALPANGGNAEYATNAGNANTVGGKSADDFVEYKPYAPIYKGNLLGIAEMGTYSCNVDDTPNLPNGVESWCYVTMINFVSSGYKRYICTPLNLINSYNNTLYLASEAYKDSDGNLIWKELSTNPVKSVQVVGTTDNVGNFILWNSSENRKPVFITYADHCVIPFLSSNGNYYAHVLSAATDEQLTGTAVTATVFYIEI